MVGVAAKGPAVAPPGKGVRAVPVNGVSVVNQAMKVDLPASASSGP